jgi:hypothetical protein
MTQPPGPPYLPGEPGYPQQSGSPGYPPPGTPGYPPPQPGYPPGSTPPAQSYPPAQGYPPTSGVPYPTSGPPGTYPYGPPAPPPPKKKRGVLIAVIAVAALLVLCGGGGVAALLATQHSSGGKGQATAYAAVQGFLTAVYQDGDATKAATYVCNTARDRAKLTKKINEIKQQNATYDTPKYSWTPPSTDSSRTNEAILSTTITLTTANEQTATQKLRFVATRNNGWWVCEVTTTT